MPSVLKDSDAVEEYELDWSAWLPAGDTFASGTWVVPTGITGTMQTFTSGKARIRLSGGTVGETYRVVSRVTTAAGLSDDRTLSVKVVNR